MLPVDTFGHYYNQSPSVRVKDDGTWRHSNIVAATTNFDEAVFIQVDDKGHATLQKWADNGDFGAKKKDDLMKELSGYEELATVDVSVAQNAK